jgi:hypothetical protein
MKRLLLIAVVLLLSVSGWSEVLAAALCPHMQRDHACCVAKDSGVHQHDQMMAHHEGMIMEGMEEMTAPATSAIEEDAHAITGPEGSCGHCMSQSGPPARSIIIARADDQSRKELRVAPAQTPGLSSPFIASSTSLITSRQNAPPGDQSARRVLISVFRI